MPVVLPPYQIHHLGHSQRNIVHTLDNFNSLFASHPDSRAAIIPPFVTAIEFSLGPKPKDQKTWTSKKKDINREILI